MLKEFYYWIIYLIFFSGFNTVLLGGLIVCEIHQSLREETPIALTLQDKGFSSLRKGLGWGRVGHSGFGFIFPSSFALLTFLFSLRKYQRTHTHTETKTARSVSNHFTPKPFPRLYQGWEESDSYSSAKEHTRIHYLFQISANSILCLFLTVTHPDIPILMVGFPVSPSVTVQHAILGHPVWAAVSSLSCYGTDLLPVAKVNLKPLIMVTVWWRPSPSTWIR